MSAGETEVYTPGAPINVIKHYFFINRFKSHHITFYHVISPHINSAHLNLSLNFSLPIFTIALCGRWSVQRLFDQALKLFIPQRCRFNPTYKEMKK